MVGENIRKIIQVSLVVLLVLTLFQGLIVGSRVNESQSMEINFRSYNRDPIIISSRNDPEYVYVTKYFEDDFFNDSKIMCKNNVYINPMLGEVKLLRRDAGYMTHYGRMGFERAKAIQQTSDGGYIILGERDGRIWLIKTDDSGNFIWQKSSQGIGNSVFVTSDGGYVITGATNCYGCGPEPKNILLIKFDSNGELRWNRSYDLGVDDEGYSVNQTSDGGFIITGKTLYHSYAKDDVFLIKTNSTGIMEWFDTYNGYWDDIGYSVQQTFDGGYIIAGTTNADARPNAWLVKTSSNGTKQWSKTFGGFDFDYFHSVRQTPDGGYIIVGTTKSYGAGGKDDYGNSCRDVWLVKTYENGTMQWNETYGGTHHDFGKSIYPTSDGGFIIVGWTITYAIQKEDDWDYFDTGEIWLIKIDNTGNMEWNRTYGGNNKDEGCSVQQTSEGGYIIAGTTRSFGIIHDNIWVIKTDKSGNMHWNKTYGWNGTDIGYSVKQTTDEGYIIVGSTESYGEGQADIWLIKTDDYHKLQWDNTYGGFKNDSGYSVQQTTDGGYIIVGYTESFGAGNADVWLIKTNDTGEMEWQRTFGGVNCDEGYSVQQTSDEGYIIIGRTCKISNDDCDVWVIKTDSSGDMQWNQTYGGIGNDWGRAGQETLDGGFIIFGTTEENGITNNDAWLIKTDNKGNMEWNKTYGGIDDDEGFFVQQTSDSGFILTGVINSIVTGSDDILLIKTDSVGNIEWEKTFDSGDLDLGHSVQQTYDGGFIVLGSIKSIDDEENGVWLIKTDIFGNMQWNETIIRTKYDDGWAVEQTFEGGFVVVGESEWFRGRNGELYIIKTNNSGHYEFYKINSFGNFTSTNILFGAKPSSIIAFNYTANIPVETQIYVQFSLDNTSWYNSSGSLNGWDSLENGSNSIDLSTKAFIGSTFYYKINFTTDGDNTPVLRYTNISFSHAINSEPSDSDKDNIPDSEDPDEDHDNLPDWWEDEWAQYAEDHDINDSFDSEDASDAMKDWDLDGLTNLEEYQQGTNPYIPDKEPEPPKDDDEKDKETQEFDYLIFLIFGIIVTIFLILLVLYLSLRRK